MDFATVARKEIACTRSFGHSLTELSDLIEAITHFASRANEKLRKQGSTAHQVMCFVLTSPFRKALQYSRSICMPLRRPTADTGALVHWCTAALVSTAVAALKAIFRPGFNYARAGVMLMDLQADTVSHVELDLEGDETPNHTRLKSTLDALNSGLEWGRC